jgi:hypothetical protein
MPFVCLFLLIPVYANEARSIGLQELRYLRIPGAQEIVSDGRTGIFYAVSHQGKRRNVYRCTISGTTSQLRFDVGDSELVGTDSLRRPVLAKHNPLFALNSSSGKTTGFRDEPFRLLCVKSGFSMGTAPSGEILASWNTGSRYEFGDNWKSLGFASGYGPAMAIDISPLGNTAAATFESGSPLIGSFSLKTKKPEFRPVRLKLQSGQILGKTWITQMALVSQSTAVALIDANALGSHPREVGLGITDHVDDGLPIRNILCRISLKTGFVSPLITLKIGTSADRVLTSIDENGTFVVVDSDEVVHLYRLRS